METPSPVANRRRRFLVVGSVVALSLVVAIFVGWQLFAPKGTTRVDEPLAGETNAIPLAMGTFRDADPVHNVEGTITVYRGDDGYFLRFEEYDATSGPDVFLYLTRTSQKPSTDDVEGTGLRLLVPGGAQEGHATLRGNFNVPLPADFDPAEWQGAAIWCNRFNALFGWAPLA